MQRKANMKTVAIETGLSTVRIPEDDWDMVKHRYNYGVISTDTVFIHVRVWSTKKPGILGFGD